MSRPYSKSELTKMTTTCTREFRGSQCARVVVDSKTTAQCAAMGAMAALLYNRCPKSPERRRFGVPSLDSSVSPTPHRNHAPPLKRRSAVTPPILRSQFLPLLASARPSPLPLASPPQWYPHLIRRHPLPPSPTPHRPHVHCPAYVSPVCQPANPRRRQPNLLHDHLHAPRATTSPRPRSSQNPSPCPSPRQHPTRRRLPPSRRTTRISPMS